MNIPAFHPEWLITFWLTTPVFRSLEPHATLAVLLAIVIGVWFYFWKKKRITAPDEQEVYFQHLLRQKQVIEQKLEQLEEMLGKGEITNEAYDKKRLDYYQVLEKVKEDLIQFT